MLFINVTANKWMNAEIHIQIDCRGMTIPESVTATQMACDQRLLGCYGDDLSRAVMLEAIRTTLTQADGSSVSRSFEREDREGWRLHIDACDEETLAKRGEWVDFRCRTVPPEMCMRMDRPEAGR